MKIFFSLALLFFVSSPRSYAQNEQELRWGKKIFAENSGKQFFNRYEGKVIVLTKQVYKYDEKIIEVLDTDSSWLPIFEAGILTPNIIAGNSAIKSKSELDSLPISERYFYNTIRSDSVKVSNLEQLNYPQQSSKVKRFRILFWRSNEMNPSLYFFELSNEKATIETDIRTFILGSKLTVFEFGSVLI